MFSHKSRYALLPDLIYMSDEGREYIYKHRRLPPKGATFHVRAYVTPRLDQRLDQVAAQTIGDPTQFWVIADANNALEPEGLIDGETPIAIPSPKVRGS